MTLKQCLILSFAEVPNSDRENMKRAPTIEDQVDVQWILLRESAVSNYAHRTTAIPPLLNASTSSSFCSRSVWSLLGKVD